MKITEEHKHTAINKIQSCFNNTDYTQDDLNKFVKSMVFLLVQINKINNTTVVAKDYNDKDISLEIIIDDIKFHHSSMMIYADRQVLRYIKEYMYDILKTLDKIDMLQQIRIAGDGFGYATCYQY